MTAHHPDTPPVDLGHHGDRDLGDGLVDLAVNVRVTAPPDWLAKVIVDSVAGLAAYPRPDAAAGAIATAHRLDLSQVLPTAGGAEAFTLVARARAWRRPLVVHPQFTEPEAALVAAGHRVERLILPADQGFVLDPVAVPDDADLVVVGNPTNPTSVLHPATMIRRLLRPGRVVVVDEAFMDAVPGEPESMIGGPMDGLLVLRSLTKTWGLAGLRAGYVVGDATVLAELAAQQPPWSVSTPALAATVACLTPEARRLADESAVAIAEARAHLIGRLIEIGLPPVAPAQAPFVLIDTRRLRGPRPAGWLRHALRDAGFAVRRGETFPGLDADWIRVAVRDPATTDALIAALLLALSGGDHRQSP